jgi:hypothetical protein
MTKKRMVKLVHAGGATKEVSEVQVLLEKKHLGVQWPTAGLMWFNFMTGLVVGAPRGPWRLTDSERAYYCELAGLRPKAASLKPLKKSHGKKQDVSDPRQLWLVEEK